MQYNWFSLINRWKYTLEWLEFPGVFLKFVSIRLKDSWIIESLTNFIGNFGDHFTGCSDCRWCIVWGGWWSNCSLKFVAHIRNKVRNLSKVLLDFRVYVCKRLRELRTQIVESSSRFGQRKTLWKELIKLGKESLEGGHETDDAVHIKVAKIVTACSCLLIITIAGWWSRCNDQNAGQGNKGFLKNEEMSY